jgi:hypothetical protein
MTFNAAIEDVHAKRRKEAYLLVGRMAVHTYIVILSQCYDQKIRCLQESFELADAAQVRFGREQCERAEAYQTLYSWLVVVRYLRLMRSHMAADRLGCRKCVVCGTGSQGQRRQRASDDDGDHAVA